MCIIYYSMWNDYCHESGLERIFNIRHLTPHNTWVYNISLCDPPEFDWESVNASRKRKREHIAQRYVRRPLTVAQGRSGRRRKRKKRAGERDWLTEEAEWEKRSQSSRRLNNRLALEWPPVSLRWFSTPRSTPKRLARLPTKTPSKENEAADQAGSRAILSKGSRFESRACPWMRLPRTPGEQRARVHNRELMSRVAEIVNGESTSRRVTSTVDPGVYNLCSSRESRLASPFSIFLSLSSRCCTRTRCDLGFLVALASNVSLRATLCGISSREEERMGSGDKESETGSTALPPGGTWDAIVVRRVHSVHQEHCPSLEATGSHRKTMN